MPTEVRSGGGDSYEQFRKTQRKLSDLRYDYLFDNSSVLFGSSERLIERIRQLQSEIGLTYLVGLFNFGTLDHDKAKRCGASPPRSYRSSGRESASNAPRLHHDRTGGGLLLRHPGRPRGRVLDAEPGDGLASGPERELVARRERRPNTGRTRRHR